MDTLDTLRANVAREKKLNAMLFFASAGVTTAFLILTRKEAEKSRNRRRHLTPSGSTEPFGSASVKWRQVDDPDR
jgi:hypothetical protein